MLAATAYAQNAKLVVVAQFKNEAESLPQWLDHYITDEGVAAMLLIDDNSSRAPRPRDAVAECLNRTKITPTSSPGTP